MYNVIINEKSIVLENENDRIVLNVQRTRFSPDYILDRLYDEFKDLSNVYTSDIEDFLVDKLKFQDCRQNS